VPNAQQQQQQLQQHQHQQSVTNPAPGLSHSVAFSVAPGGANGNTALRRAESLYDRRRRALAQLRESLLDAEDAAVKVMRASTSAGTGQKRVSSAARPPLKRGGTGVGAIVGSQSSLWRLTRSEDDAAADFDGVASSTFDSHRQHDDNELAAFASLDSAGDEDGPAVGDGEATTAMQIASSRFMALAKLVYESARNETDAGGEFLHAAALVERQQARRAEELGAVQGQQDEAKSRNAVSMAVHVATQGGSLVDVAHAAALGARSVVAGNANNGSRSIVHDGTMVTSMSASVFGDPPLVQTSAPVVSQLISAGGGFPDDSFMVNSSQFVNNNNKGSHNGGSGDLTSGIHRPVSTGTAVVVKRPAMASAMGGGDVSHQQHYGQQHVQQAPPSQPQTPNASAIAPSGGRFRIGSAVLQPAAAATSPHTTTGNNISHLQPHLIQQPQQHARSVSPNRRASTAGTDVGPYPVRTVYDVALENGTGTGVIEGILRDHAQPGDLILLRPGTYYENLIVRADVEIRAVRNDLPILGGAEAAPGDEQMWFDFPTPDRDSRSTGGHHQQQQRGRFNGGVRTLFGGDNGAGRVVAASVPAPPGSFAGPGVVNIPVPSWRHVASTDDSVRLVPTDQTLPTVRLVGGDQVTCTFRGVHFLKLADPTRAIQAVQAEVAEQERAQKHFRDAVDLATHPPSRVANNGIDPRSVHAADDIFEGGRTFNGHFVRTPGTGGAAGAAGAAASARALQSTSEGVAHVTTAGQGILHLEGCTVTGGGGGVVATGRSEVYANRCVMFGCSFAAFYAKDSSYVALRRVRCSDQCETGVRVRDAKARLESCQVSDCRQDGVAIHGRGRVYLQSTILEQNGGNGVSVCHSDANVALAGCIVGRNTGWGIEVPAPRGPQNPFGIRRSSTQPNNYVIDAATSFVQNGLGECSDSGGVALVEALRGTASRNGVNVAASRATVDELVVAAAASGGFIEGGGGRPSPPRRLNATGIVAPMLPSPPRRATADALAIAGQPAARAAAADAAARMTTGTPAAQQRAYDGAIRRTSPTRAFGSPSDPSNVGGRAASPGSASRADRGRTKTPPMGQSITHRHANAAFSPTRTPTTTTRERRLMREAQAQAAVAAVPANAGAGRATTTGSRSSTGGASTAAFVDPLESTRRPSDVSGGGVGAAAFRGGNGGAPHTTTGASAAVVKQPPHMRSAAPVPSVVPAAALGSRPRIVGGSWP
jgi:hypothetical protein